ncbi:MAG TPA: hypothetical protein VHL10_09660 [Nitrososphaera sp.]|nr:hypothetical protein [Nitrososphaera sp.]
MERLIFHHGGKEYTIYDALTPDEIQTIMIMSEERNKKLDALNARSMKKYFEDTDKMVAIILRRCFHMTDSQIAGMEQLECRNLAHAFIRFIATANGLASPR